MTEAITALLVDEVRIGLNEFASSCTVSREWIIEHVEAGVLPDRVEPDPAHWSFTSRDLIRARHLEALERQFDANPQLAGLVVDLVEELNRLRARLKREGLSLD